MAQAPTGDNTTTTTTTAPTGGGNTNPAPGANPTTPAAATPTPGRARRARTWLWKWLKWPIGIALVLMAAAILLVKCNTGETPPSDAPPVQKTGEAPRQQSPAPEVLPKEASGNKTAPVTTSRVVAEPPPADTAKVAPVTQQPQQATIPAQPSAQQAGPATTTDPALLERIRALEAQLAATKQPPLPQTQLVAPAGGAAPDPTLQKLHELQLELARMQGAQAERNRTPPATQQPRGYWRETTITK